MTQIWQNGKVVPCTIIEAGPCFVCQVKSQEKDGYQAVQLGFDKKTKNIKKPQKGKEYRYIREWKGAQGFEVGQQVDVSFFKEGEKVKVAGITKGKGFQGAVKRWNFKGRNQTHGVKHEQRTVGSIGSSGPGRVFKGRKMPGHMGANRVTMGNLAVVKIVPEHNLLVIKGAVPGHRGTILEIKQNESL